MSNIVVSFAIKKDISSVIIIEDGIIKAKHTEYIKDENAKRTNYSGIIYAFKLALRQVRQYIQTSDARKICFETSNSTLIKWLDNQYAKDDYQDEFNEALILLHELPIKYAFTYVEKTKAVTFAHKDYIKKVAVSGLNLDLED